MASCTFFLRRVRVHIPLIPVASSLIYKMFQKFDVKLWELVVNENKKKRILTRVDSKVIHFGVTRRSHDRMLQARNM